MSHALMIYEGASEQEMLKVARQQYPGIEADGRRRILAVKPVLPRCCG